jgi:serine/threonine-protein kinase
VLGKTISHYKVLEKIGEGGMGEVYRATDTKLNRDVALKILPEQFASDSHRMGRFQREAEVLASLDHPNIGQIYGIEEAGQTKALVLQLIEGPTLADKIAQGPIPVEDALKIALQMAEGLEAAHEKGVIHRDLKPANIKITPEGQVKILDFGLAKALEGEVPESSLSQSPTLTNAATQAGVILGTAAYMSPEQAKGKTVDKRADIWAFGAVLYEMLSGRQSFGGSDVSEALAAVIRADPDWDTLPENLHPRLKEVLERCLEKDSNRRFRDIGDVKVDIENILSDPSGLLVQPVTEVAQVAPQSKLPWVAAILLAIVITGFAVWSVMRPESPSLVRFAVSPDEAVPLYIAITSPDIAISPDGEHIAYLTGAVGGGGEWLHVRPLDQLTSETLVAEGSLNSPFFSPDGESVGFYDRSITPPVLKRVAVRGGPVSTICELPEDLRGASWGADGNIVFASSDTSSGLWRVPAVGGQPEQLTTPDSEGREGGHLWPEVLPGGEAVLFTINAVQEPQIAVLTLGTGEQKILIRGGSYPQYSPTGHLIYQVGGNLWAVAFDLNRLNTVGDPVPVQENVLTKPLGAADFSVSESGTLAYLSGEVAISGLRTLGLVDRNGLVERLNVPPKEYLSPRLSPDGKSLVVQSLEESGNVIWVYDLTGDTAIQQLTFESNNNRPVWTPDSQRITFSSDRDGTMSLYWMPADGSGVAERLTTAEEGTSHWMGSWSPDGELLVFNVRRDTTDWDIWSLSVADRVTQSLYGSPGMVYVGAELSPNAEWLAYGAGPNPLRVDIYVEPFPPTGARRRISQDGGYWPLWSPEGSKLFYRPFSRGAGITLRSVDIVTQPAFAFSNEQTLPVEGFKVVATYRDYDITPDGEQLLMVFPANRSDTGEPARPQINIVLNWFEELKERVPVP